MKLQNIFKKRQNKASDTRLTPVTTTLLIVLIAYTLSLIIPLFWALITSLKDNLNDFRLNIIGLPKKWMWSNYTFVLQNFYEDVPSADGNRSVTLAEMFLNTILYSLGCSFFNTLVPCLTAYMCAKFDFKFSNVLYTVVIVTMVLPIVGNLPSEIRVATFFGLYNQIWGLWIMKANFLGLYFLVFYGMFKSQPKAYSEAARIDGAGNFTIMTRISLPLIASTFFTIMIINFIGFWNDYQTPLVYLPSYPTAALGMFRMAKTTLNGLSEVPMRMAAAMLILIPILIVFLCFHKRMLGNLTVGGIKG